MRRRGGGGAEIVILVPWESPTVLPEPQASKFLGAGRQRIIGQPSLDVVGPGDPREADERSCDA